MQNSSDQPNDDSTVDPKTTTNNHHSYHSHHSYHDNHNHHTTGNFFWGLFLILIGGLVLASNFGIINVEWSNLWRLWPLFIISAGFSILSIHHQVWRIFSIIISLLMIGAIAWILIGYSPNSVPIHSSNLIVQKSSDSIKQAIINVNAGAGSIDINTADQTNVAVARLDSNITTLSDSSNVDDTTQKVDFSLNDYSQWWAGNIKNSLSINLSRNLPISLNIYAGASNINVDMSQAQLSAMTIKAGASSLSIRLGDKQDYTSINIDSGVSSIVVKVPAGSGVKLTVDGGLTDKHLTDLSKTSDSTFESTDYLSSKKKIFITSKIGVSSLTVERY